VDTTALEEEAERVYADRAVTNRAVRNLEAQIAAMPYHEGLGTELKDAGEVSSRLEKAISENASNEKRLGELDDANDAISDLQIEEKGIADKIATIKAQLQAAENEADLIEEARVKAVESRDKIHAEISALVDVDLDPIRAEMSELSKHNAQIAENAARSAEAKRLRTYEDESRKKTERLAAIEAEKAKLLRQAKFPIEGLAFTAAGVTFNGQPFNQASAAEQLRVSVAMGAAMQPKLKVALVRDGSLLDNDSLAARIRAEPRYAVRKANADELGVVAKRLHERTAGCETWRAPAALPATPKPNGIMWPIRPTDEMPWADVD